MWDAVDNSVTQQIPQPNQGEFNRQNNQRNQPPRGKGKIIVIAVGIILALIVSIILISVRAGKGNHEANDVKDEFATFINGNSELNGISKESEKYITKHYDLFLHHEKSASEKVATTETDQKDITPENYTKYQDKLIRINGEMLGVEKTNIFTTPRGVPCSLSIVEVGEKGSDGNEGCLLLYRAKTDELIENADLTAYGVPVSTTTYDTGAGEKKLVVYAASYIETGKVAIVSSAATTQAAAETTKSEPSSAPQPQTQPAINETTIAQETTLQAENTNGPHVIVPDSSSRPLTKSDIANLSPDEIRIAVNEIYARHGRLFNDPQLQSWFSSQAWYQGKIKPDDFSEDLLSKIEKDNILLMQGKSSEGGSSKQGTNNICGEYELRYNDGGAELIVEYTSGDDQYTASFSGSTGQYAGEAGGILTKVAGSTYNCSEDGSTFMTIVFTDSGATVTTTDYKYVIGGTGFGGFDGNYKKTKTYPMP